jgi:hypothetical protein
MIARCREKAESTPPLAGVPQGSCTQVKTPVGYTRRPQAADQDQHDPSAKFLAQHSTLTSRIHSIVEQDVSRSLGEAPMIARHRVRDRDIQPVA